MMFRLRKQVHVTKVAFMRTTILSVFTIARSLQDWVLKRQSLWIRALLSAHRRQNYLEKYLLVNPNSDVNISQTPEVKTSCYEKRMENAMQDKITLIKKKITTLSSY